MKQKIQTALVGLLGIFAMMLFSTSLLNCPLAGKMEAVKKVMSSMIFFIRNCLVRGYELFPRYQF